MMKRASFIRTLIHLEVLLQLRIHNREIILPHQEAIFVLALAMMGLVAPTLLPTKSESRESIAIYNPQRLKRYVGTKEM